jgi:hypothetical protein
MTAVNGGVADANESTSSARAWWTVGQGAAALAAGMGVGRFAYTPILPLMHAQAGLSPQLGADLATANYIGYLVGAVATIVAPALARSQSTLRLALLVLVGTLALMPTTHVGTFWFVLRLLAGVMSALIFVITASAMLSGLRPHAHHVTGWAFGGVGAGIALSGILVLTLRTSGTWQEAWWSAAALTAVLTVLAWRLESGRSSDHQPAADLPRSGDGVGRRCFGWLLVSYTLEGVGYIIAGTFLVAAIDQTAPGWVGSGAWVLVGLAAVPSSALLAWLSRTWSRPTLLCAALIVQAIGIGLPALIGGITPALISAILFGTTFLGIAAIALAIGAHLQVPRAVAILTTGYSAGQILGPLAVTPFLHNGYHQALLIGAGLVGVAAIAAGALRHRFPHHPGPVPRRVRAATDHTTYVGS